MHLHLIVGSLEALYGAKSLQIYIVREYNENNFGHSL